MAERVEVALRGRALLNEASLNKGTAGAGVSHGLGASGRATLMRAVGW